MPPACTAKRCGCSGPNCRSWPRCRAPPSAGDSAWPARPTSGWRPLTPASPPTSPGWRSTRASASASPSPRSWATRRRWRCSTSVAGFPVTRRSPWVCATDWYLWLRSADRGPGPGRGHRPVRPAGHPVDPPDHAGPPRRRGGRGITEREDAEQIRLRATSRLRRGDQGDRRARDPELHRPLARAGGGPLRSSGPPGRSRRVPGLHPDARRGCHPNRPVGQDRPGRPILGAKLVSRRRKRALEGTEVGRETKTGPRKCSAGTPGGPSRRGGDGARPGAGLGWPPLRWSLGLEPQARQSVDLVVHPDGSHDHGQDEQHRHHEGEDHVGLAGD